MGMNEDWEKRVLCSDESCIGTIGANGRCRECGLAFEGDLPEDGFHDAQGTEESTPTATQQDNDTGHSSDETDAPAEDEERDPAAGPDDEWERRTLCRDESCIGVIDEKTGCCKECGKPLREA